MKSEGAVLPIAHPFAGTIGKFNFNLCAKYLLLCAKQTTKLSPKTILIII